MVTRAVIQRALLGTLGLLLTLLLLSSAASVYAGWFALAPAQAAPSLTPPSAETPGQGGQTYTVVAGDTLGRIAKKFYGDSGQYPLIVRANKLSANSILRIGQVLVIPPLGGEGGATSPTQAKPGISSEPASRQVLPTVPAAQPPTSASVVAPLPATGAQPKKSPTLASSSTPVPSTRSSLSEAAANMQTPITIALDVISGICLIAAFVLSDRAYQTYRRVRRTERRVMMARRVYSADDELLQSLN